MPTLEDLFDLDLLARMIDERLVNVQRHPTEQLSILNYTQKAAYDGEWNPCTMQCRGLIFSNDQDDYGRIVARPFPKFFNYGQEGEPELDLNARVFVSDKLDGSLGILYPTSADFGGAALYGTVATRWAVATRGSFSSDQALHASYIWKTKYEGRWTPAVGVTYLFEIIYPANRIVVDYHGLDDLVLLALIDTATGQPVCEKAGDPTNWPGPSAEEHPYRSLAEALAAEPRPNAEGLVVWFPDTNARVKIKQDDYMALHRILTGTNARNVWEVAAVRACESFILEEKHWGSFLGIDPARAREVRAVGRRWLEEVPDEFHQWVKEVTYRVVEDAVTTFERCCKLSIEARGIEDQRERYQFVASSGGPYVKDIMRAAGTAWEDPAGLVKSISMMYLRCWREAAPEATTPWARTEDVA